MNQPLLFSIIVPTYNRAHIICDTINSILAQTYPHFEIIIVDDGSKDNTGEMVQKLLSDKVFYYKKVNEERSAARNFGVLKAKGDYVNCFDSDDIMFPDHLEKAALYLPQFNDPEFFSLGFQYQDENGQVLYTSHYTNNLNSEFYKGNRLAVDSVFIRKDIAIANPYNEDRELSGSEDFELWLRLATKYKVYTRPDITVGFIHHGERSTIAMSDPAQLIKRYTKFIHYTTTNAEVQKLLGNKFSFFLMKNYLLLAVDLANNNHLALARNYILKAFSHSPLLIFQKGFYAFFKHYFKNSLFDL